MPNLRKKEITIDFNGNFLKAFTMPNLRKKEITIDFNGNLGHLWGVITH